MRPAPQLGTKTACFPRASLWHAWSRFVRGIYVPASALSALAFAFLPAMATPAAPASRFLTRSDVLPVIRLSLENNPRIEASSVDLSSLEMSAQISVPPLDPQLEVTQIDYDAALRRVRFRLWPKAVPSVVPFFATARLTDSAAAPPRSFTHATRGLAVPSFFQTAGPILVETGRSARLRLHSPDSEMLLVVKPLQRGRLGDIIRVHIPTTGATLRARVVAPGYLDASF